MLVVLPPYSSEQIRPGQVGFFSSDTFMGDGIARETDGADYGEGQLVATHVGIILEDLHVAEAWWPGWRIAPLSPRLALRDPLIWVKTPAGQTPESARELCRMARGLEGTDYDVGGVAAFLFSDQDDLGVDASWLEDPQKLFCSEGVAMLLMQTEHLRSVPLPESFKRVHPSRRSPEGLNESPIWEVSEFRNFHPSAGPPRPGRTAA